MANIIDSLILTLELDPSNFSKGQKEAAEGLLKLKNSMTDTGKAVDEGAKKSVQAVQEFRDTILSLFAVFTGGKAIKEFVEDLVKTNSALGRVAMSTDQTVKTLSTWTGAGATVGASNSEMIGSIQHLTSEYQKFALTGKSSIVPVFRSLGIAMESQPGKMRNINDVLKDLRTSFLNMHDPARAKEFADMLGLSVGMYNTLMQSDKDFNESLAFGEKMKPSEADIAAAYGLQKAWAELGMSSQKVGLNFLTVVSPAIKLVLDGLTKFFEFLNDHRFIADALIATLFALAGALTLVVTAAVAGAAIAQITAGLSAFMSLCEGFIALAPSMAAAWTIATGPIGLTVAAIAAVIAAGYVLYDDWKTWTQGGESLFGGFYSSIEDGWNKVVENFTKGWDKVKHNDDLKTWTQGGESLFGGFYSSIEDGWNKVVENFTKGWDKVKHIWYSLTGQKEPKATEVKVEAKKSPSSKAPAQKMAQNAPGSASDQAIDAVMQNEDRGLTGKVTSDTGGLTKYGISQKAFPGVNIANLTPDQARAIYKKEYWDKIGGDKIPPELQKVAMDTAVNQGVGKAKQFIAESGGDVNKFNSLRRQHYISLAESNPEKYGKYLKGWLNRVGQPDSNQMPLSGARGAMIASNSNNSRTMNHSAETHIGSINVTVPGGDSKEIAKGIGTAVQRNTFATQANYGAV